VLTINMGRNKSRTGTHHCPMKSHGGCRLENGYCSVHELLHGAIIHLKTQGCHQCTCTACEKFEDCILPANDRKCAPCKKEAEKAKEEANDPNRCPSRSPTSNCSWKKDLGYCTSHQAKCYSHGSTYLASDGCPSCLK